ncbi:hypothetical protein AMQ83_23795, partial [Paenibacillus riograndensis]
MTMNKTKKAALLGMTGVLALFTAACGNSNSADNASGSGNGNGNAEETVTLNMMHPWTSPNVDNKVYKARIAKFEEKHPN